jgi:hypothetical protein
MKRSTIRLTILWAAGVALILAISPRAPLPRAIQLGPIEIGLGSGTGSVEASQRGSARDALWVSDDAECPEGQSSTGAGVVLRAIRVQGDNQSELGELQLLEHLIQIDRAPITVPGTPSIS